MSDARRIARDARRTVSGAATMERDAVGEARRMLEWLMRREHRGPSDTWTAARDRTAGRVGITRSYARRIWQQAERMTDVSGTALLRLQAAYECEVARANALADRINEAAEGMECAGEATQSVGARPGGARPLPRQATATEPQS